MPHPPAYLEFINLFNERLFFEAHEELESLWRNEMGPDRFFYQGLIQLAALFVQLENKNVTGAKRLLHTATAYLRPYGAVHRGLDLQVLLAEIQEGIDKDGFYLKKKLLLAP